MIGQGFCSTCSCRHFHLLCLIIIFIIISQQDLLVKSVTSATPSSLSLTDILDDLELHLDNRVRPEYGEKVLEIHAYAFIRNVVNINEVHSTLTLSFLFMQIWENQRLAYSEDSKVKEVLIDNNDFISKFWTPDTFITNEVKSQFCCGGSGANHEQKQSLAHQILNIAPSGRMLKTTRLSVTVSCPMKLQRYPFHRFECDVELESFGHKTDNILYIWRNGSKSVDYTKIDKASLAGTTSYLLEGVESHSQQSYLDSGGSYSKLIIRLRFSKLWLRHSIVFFIPTVILTLTSLLTLWLLTEDKHAGIGVTVNFVIAGFVILLGALEYSTTPVLGQVAFFTPIDIHLGICLSTILSSVMVHTVALCVRKRCTTDSRRQSTAQRKVRDASEENDNEVQAPLSSTNKVASSDQSQEGGYYESYDVTTDEVFEDGRRGSGEQGVPSKGNCQVKGAYCHENAVDESSGSSSTSGSSLKKKGCAARCVSQLVRVSMLVSKWMSLVSFVVAESVFWYSYVLSSSSS